MSINDYTKILESILFATEEPISIKKIAEIMEITEQDVEKICIELKNYYELQKRGVMLYSFDEHLQLGTNPFYDDYLKKTLNKSTTRGLSESVLEVLSIIAYKQPITKAEIDYVRGVKSDYAVRSLLDRGLIEEQGRLDKIGKPKVYGTSQLFLRNFQLNSLKDLPIIHEEADEI